MKSHLALITILDGSGLGLRPDNTLPGLPTYPDQGLPGGGGYPDQGLPGQPGRPDQGLPPFPSQGLPGHGVGGGHPAHPIQLPPVTPDNTLPPTETQPPQISLPIVLPPDAVIDGEALFELKYSLRYGWVLVPVKDPVAAPKA